MHEAVGSGARPETALLLACARTRMDPEHAGQIRALLGQDINWAGLMQMAQRHKITPLLCRSLASTLPDAVPQAVMEELRKRSRANALRSLRLTRQLIRVLRGLESDGVLAVPYRGPMLAEAVYGDLGLRQFTDLDVLVRRRDVSKAREVLVSLGYRTTEPHKVLEAVYIQSMHHYALSGGPRKALLELHWRITERYFGFRLDPQLWERLESAHLAGSKVPSLSAEDSLLTSCVHSSKHGWERLAWTCDVAEMIRARADMDWERAVWLARRQEAERMVLLGLFLARDLLGAELPPEVSQRVQADSVLRSLGLEVRERLFQEAQGRHDASGRLRLFGFHLRLRESLWGKVRHCLRIALIPSQEDWALLSLPASLSFLYYVIHPFRLAAKHCARWLRPWL